MKNKQITLLIILLFFTLIGTAQTPIKVKKGNKAFENFSYEKAIRLYKGLEDGSVAVKRNLAISLWKLNRVQEAEVLFKEIVATEGHLPEDFYHYAALLRENKKYTDAEVWMRKYGNLGVEDGRAKLYREDIGSFRRLEKPDKNFTIKNLEMNSEQQDFGTSFYKRKVVFVSSREGIKPVRRKWNRTKLPFLDIYVAEKADDCELTNPLFLSDSKEINNKFHEGPVAFSEDGNFMVFTRNNYDGESAKGVKRLQLFSAYFKDGKWGKPESLPFNNDEYSVGHAAISKDGKWLYFASNMPGGIGGVDLYRAEIKGQGSYGEAINLGNRINTEGDEMFPFLHENGEMLFFSSNGRVGLGGQDVFLAQLKDENEIGKISNLGAPINGSADDYALILSKDQKIGYFSSNRKEGKGSDDIYSFSLSRPFIFGVLIKGTVRNGDGEVLAGATVTLFDLFTGEEDLVIADENGNFEFHAQEGKTFNLRARKQDYFDGINVADTKYDGELVAADLVLERDPGLSISALLTNNVSGEPIQEVTIKLVDNITGAVEEFITSRNGKYQKVLSEKRLKDSVSYDIILEKRGFLSKRLTYTNVFNESGTYNMNDSLDFSMGKIVVEGDLLKIAGLNTISFPKGKAVILPKVAQELDQIVQIMTTYPNMEIEIGIHTDTRGSEFKNLSLSDKQARIAAKYIAVRISNPERIRGRGYGQNIPKVMDASQYGGSAEQQLTETFIKSFKGVNDNLFEVLHQLNNRSEFIILKIY